MNQKRLVALVIVVMMILALFPTVASAKRPTVELSNNLSFPAIAVDGFAITPLVAPSFTVPYAGDYPGLTAEEIAWLEANGPWYAQKTTGNVWQADFVNQGSVSVSMIDWSDNMESINPKVRSTFRLELVLFVNLDAPMTAYTMAQLEYPNSASELQGTNATTYDSSIATVISAKPLLGIQYLGSEVPVLIWNGSAWELEDGTIPQIVPVSFAPELNVGGKYIYGASKGGWKPTQVGYYRITFYIPESSGIDLTLAEIGNLPTEAVATAVIDLDNNLTYIDVQALRR